MQENKLKVLHTADLHLGSAFSNLPPEIAAELRKEQKDMLFRLIGICREEGAGLLLLAGDVFVRPFPDKSLSVFSWIR
jgi:DNA repair exonuclease SbcCD nuclease subunit